MRNIKKYFWLPYKYNLTKGQNVIDELNDKLDCVGVHFSLSSSEKGNRLYVNVDDEKLKAVVVKDEKKPGRPMEHEIDFEQIMKMKASGKTNKEIYTELDISKSLFYLRMREYKNNIGQ